MQKSFARHLLAGAPLVGLAALVGAPVAAQSPAPGAVFVGTNHNNTCRNRTESPCPTVPQDEPGNQVVMYNRAPDGALTLAGRFDTGGQGSGPSIRFAGDGLGAAHSVELSQDNRWLFVTNFASHDVSVFRVSKEGLGLTDLASTTPQGDPSAGFPNSVTQHGDLVYVLNSGGAGSITGFRLSNQGTLIPIPGSSRVLNANQSHQRPDTLFNPAEVSFTPDGRQLVVTIKDAANLPGVTPTGPGRVLVFNVGRDGRPSEHFAQTNLGNHGPFGFSFDRQGNLLVALFLGGPGFTGAAGSFRPNTDGTLTAITPDVVNGQLDTCWIENNGKYAYTANYTSGNVSSYSIGSNGKLTLLEANAGTTEAPVPLKTQGSTPLDIRVSNNGQFLYDVLPGSGKVAGWRINNGNGKLTKIGEFPITIHSGGVDRLLDTVNGDVAQCEVSHGVFENCEFGPGGSPAGIAAF
jgi:6-phosphogluconolactonase